MAELYRFFDSTIDDIREYTADEFAEYFRMVLTSGIYNGGTNLQVTASGNDMSVTVGEGYALINGYLYKVVEGVNLLLDTADTSQDRIDRVVLRWDNNEGNRFIKAFVLTGSPSDNPVPPALTREGNVYELSLAQVRVPAGKNFVDGSTIADERLNAEVCGLINSLIQADTTEIFRQFNDWYAVKIPEYQEQWANWYENQTKSAISDVATFDIWLSGKKAEFKAQWDEWFETQTESAISDVATFDIWLSGKKAKFQEQWDEWYSEQTSKGFILASEKGVPNGVAPLNAEGKVVDAEGNEVGGWVKEALDEHLSSDMPHKFTDETGNTFNYGFKVSNGNLIFIYEGEN